MTTRKSFSLTSRITLLGLAISLACLALPAQNSGSQGETTSHPFTAIVGTVWGPDGAPRYGVMIKIRREDDKNAKKARWEVYSDHRGEFDQRVPLTAADYIVWADLKSYKGPDKKTLQPGDEVKVHVESNTNQQIRLDTGVHLK